MSNTLNINDLKAALVAKKWEEKSIMTHETLQRVSFWYNDINPNKDVHLMVVEDLTPAQRYPGLFIYTYETGWRQINVEDIG